VKFNFQTPTSKLSVLISDRLDEGQLASASDEGRKLSADAAIALALDDLGIED